MRNSVAKLQKIGFIFTGISGVILHFLYEWTGNALIFAPFSGVNESTWEHMKLLFFPLFIYALIEYKIIGKEYKSYWCIKLAGILTALAAVPMLYYTCIGVFGRSPDLFNIAIFYIAAAIAFVFEYYLFKNRCKCRYYGLPLIILFIVALSFVLFTFKSPHIPLFRDPISGIYGI